MSSLHLKTKEQNIGWIEWDDPSSSTNVLSVHLLDEFSQLVDRLEKEDFKVLVLVSKKPSVFIAGADIKDIQNIDSKEDFKKVLDKAHNVLNRFEKLKASKIAAINGACLGGGFELALAFDYRLAADSPKVKIGLPEVKLGLLPGFGGCIRCPRLVGLKTSLDMILTGKNYPAKVALKKSLVHEVVPSAILNERVLELARDILNGKKEPHPSQKYKPKNLIEFILEKVFKQIIFFISKQKILKETKGFYPAPLKALKVIQKTYGSSHLEKSLKKETEAFCEVAVTSESKNLIRIFFLMNQIKKQKKSEQIKPINQIAVLGAGVMGSGIAYLCADRGYNTRLKDIQAESISKSLNHANNLWKKQYKRRRLTTHQWDKNKFLLSGSLNYSGFSNMDLVIEAISEDQDIKEKVISESAKHLNPSTIFASNTSSLSISKLAKSYPWPERFVGIHFFNPAYKMPLVEIIKTDQNDEKTLASAFEFAKSLGKIPVIVKDSPGFIVNRMLMPYLTEALWLLKDGNNIKEVDRYYTHKFGLPMGPFRLMDEVGLDICTNVISIFQKSGLKQLDVPQNTEKLTEVLGLGKKEGKGFYIYEGEDYLINKKTSFFQKEKILSTPEDIINRGIYRIINEGRKLLEESVVTNENDIDIAMMFGIGFPPFLGGPMNYAKHLGLQKIKTQLKEFSKKLGSRFEPYSHF